jgi:hypothetical protein
MSALLCRLFHRRFHNLEHVGYGRYRCLRCLRCGRAWTDHDVG